MSEITIKRWTRYGHDRAYARDGNGNNLGWICLKTQALHLEDTPLAASAAAALADFCAQQGGSSETHSRGRDNPGDSKPDTSADVITSTPPVSTARQVTPTATSIPSATSLTSKHVDLALNVPGQGVRAQADAAWAKSKEESKFFSYFARIFDIHTEERAWRCGAEGEEFVGEKLNRLRAHGWRVLHSIPVGRGDSDIDHLLIGPGGIFTVNSKAHAGKRIWVARYQMRVNGQPVPYLRNARHEASRAARLLGRATGLQFAVQGVVVVLTGTVIPNITYRDRPDDVHVLTKWDVPRWFARKRAVLSDAAIERLFEAARRPETWRT